jgi:hypothetical protein
MIPPEATAFMRRWIWTLGLLACGLLQGDPVIHKFEVWKRRSDEGKLGLYIGWTNGFLTAGEPKFTSDLISCLGAVSYKQAVAMIDKYFEARPERWSATLTEGILEALTVPGSACEGKNPLNLGQK